MGMPEREYTEMWGRNKNRRQSPSSTSCRNQDQSKEAHSRGWLKERHLSYTAIGLLILSKCFNILKCKMASYHTDEFWIFVAK